MAKKQTRRSISVSRNTYERLKAYCETNGISMSQFVERRVGDYLGRSIDRHQTVTVSQASEPTSSLPQTTTSPSSQTGDPDVKLTPDRDLHLLVAALVAALLGRSPGQPPVSGFGCADEPLEGGRLPGGGGGGPWRRKQEPVEGFLAAA